MREDRDQSRALLGAFSPRIFRCVDGGTDRRRRGARANQGAVFAIEDDISKRKLVGEAKTLHRLTHSKPVVELFFEWVDRQLERQGFTPSNPYIQALNYVRVRRVGLEIFLTDPDVPIRYESPGTRIARVPMGRKTGYFAGPNSAPSTSA
jgi:hypothetical protein